MIGSKKYQLSFFIQQFGGELVGIDCVVDRILPLELAFEGSCAFVVSKKHLHKLSACKASAIIAPQDCIALIQQEQPQIALIVSDNPYLYFSKVMTLFHPRKKLEKSKKCWYQVDETSHIAESAVIADFVTVGKRSILHNNVEIHHGCFIGDDVVIGSNSVIHPNVTIMDKVSIGENCIVHSGTVIGADGFGNAQDKNKHYHKIPQIGGVEIGDWVEIGSNTSIDSGTFTPTKIGNGARIDNLIQIAHNVVVGDHAAIAACTGIAGSTVVGKHCIIAGAANITGHVTIADGAMIGGSSNVSNDIKVPGVYTSGFPSMLHLQWGKLVALFKRLPEMMASIRQLQKDVADLKDKSTEK